MKIEQSKLTKRVSNVMRAVATRPTLPIIAYIKMVLDDNTLTLTGTDLEKTFVERIDVDSGETFECCVPGRLFAELIGTMSGEIEITLKKNALVLVNAGDEAKVKTMETTKFPLVQDLPDVDPVTIKSDDLKYLIGNVYFSAATDETKPTLKGIYLEFGDKIFASAADGYRMSYCQYPLSVKLPSVIVTANTLKEVASIFPDENCDVDIYTTDTQIIFELTESRLVCQLIQGKFPEVSSVIPKNHTVMAEIKTQPFKSALLKLLVFAKNSDNVITMEYQDNAVTLYADGGETGRANAVIDAVVNGDLFKTAFNGLLMKDALSTVDKAFVIKQESEHKPLVISPLDRQEDVIQVIMPMQVRAKQDD